MVLHPSSWCLNLCYPTLAKHLLLRLRFLGRAARSKARISVSKYLASRKFQPENEFQVLRSVLAVCAHKLAPSISLCLSSFW